MDINADLQKQATDAIISAFGGLSEMARELGHKNPTTIQGWKDRGNIPSRQQPHVLDAAQRLRLDLGPMDFFRPKLAKDRAA